MKNFLSDFLDFLLAVLGRWALLLTGGLLAAAIVVYEHVKGQPLGTVTSAGLFAALLLTAIFLAWRKERVRARALEQLPLPPGVEIEDYDPVLRPDQAWHVRIRDRNNPDLDLVVNVEIIQGRLFASIQNRHGRDRSANLRPVRIEAP